MKFFALLALCGFASAVRLSSDAQLKWQPGHEYEYSYRGRLLTGLPELSDRHFSGMGIHAKIHLRVLDEGRVSLTIPDARYTRFNEELQPSSASQDGHNWRYLPLPGYSAVPEETMRLLRQPTVFQLSVESGRVHSVVVSSEESEKAEWSINFKKALVAQLQLQSSGEHGSYRTNSVDEYVNSRSVPFQNYWTVMEQSVDGECETRYEINQLPESTVYDEEMISGLESGFESGSSEGRMVPLPEQCPTGSKLYEITKVRNVNKCVVRSSFSFYKPGGYKCQPGFGSSKTGNCEGMSSRSSVTRYVVCGRSESDYVILSIVNEGELNQDLLGSKAEKMTTGTRQVFQLLNKNRRGSISSSSHEHIPSSPVTLDSLFYEHSGVKKSHESLKKELHDGSHRSAIKHITFLESAIKSGKKDEVRQQMKELLRQIVEHDLFTVQGLPETQIPIKALGVAKGFRIFSSVEEIEQLYHELKSAFSGDKSYVYRNIYFDTCIMSGTIPSVRFLKKMILQGEMSPHMAQSFFLSMAGNVITPTAPLLEELYELVVSGKVRELSRESNVYNTAVLGYSTLIEKACLSSNRNTSYPTFVFGKFCHHDSYIVTEKWIPYLARELRQTEHSMTERKNVYVVALGLLSHKNVLPSLYYVLDTPEHSSPLLRTLAVYSLTRTGRHYPRIVLPVLSSVFTNRAEKTEVRVAAFNVIMKLNPQMYYLQKIASSTWYETDLEILKLVNTAFYSLSKAYAMQSYKPESSLLVRRVRLLYPLIKKTGGRFPTTGSIYLNDYLKYLNVGFEKVLSYTATKDSSLPTDIYSKLSYFLDSYRYTPIEYSLHLRGSGNLIEEIIEIISGKSSSSKVESEESSSSGVEHEIVSRVTGEWRKVVEKLNIDTRRGDNYERPEGALFLNVFETYPIFKSFAKESTESLKHQIKRVLKNPFSLMEKLRGSSGSDLISYQRMFNLAPSIVMVPSDMGLPIVVEVHMPLVLSVRGRVEPESLSLNRIALKTKLHAMATVQYSGWVGTICPFTGEYLRTGIDQHATVNFPNEFHVTVDRSQQEIKIKMVNTVSSPYDLFHYRVRPFTVQQKYYDIKPLTLAHSFKVIKSNAFPKTRSTVAPEVETFPILKSTGLGLYMSFMSPVYRRGPVSPTLIEKFKMYNDNPMNVLRFAFVSTAVSPSQLPSIRNHFIKISQHPEKASTKEIVWSLKYGYASKESASKPIMYHVLEKKPISSERIIPVGIESRPIGEISKHPVRQEKLKELIREMNEPQESYGLVLSVRTTLVGSVPRNYVWTVMAGFGKHAEIKTKWNLKMETEGSEMPKEKYCFRGLLDLPLTSVYDIEKILSEENRYRFESQLGYGSSSCMEKSVKVTGYTKTSHEMKEIARNSKEVRELKKMIERRVPLIKLSGLAEKVKRMSSLLDEVDFEIEYENLPYHYVFYGEKFVDFLKLYWLPYLRTGYSPYNFVSEESVESESLYSTTMSSIRKLYSGSESESEIESHRRRSHLPRSIEYMLKNGGEYYGRQTSGKVVYKIKFHPIRKTFSLTIIPSGSSSGGVSQTVKFDDIRIPFPLSYYFPLYASYSPVYSLEKTLTGYSYNPVCKVQGNYLSTYDNETVPMRMTPCWHLLTTPCVHQGEWSVLIGKSHKVEEYKNVKVLIHGVDVLLIPTGRHSLEVKVHGSEMSLRKGETKHIYENGLRGGRVIATISKSEDETISFQTTWFNLAFDGYHIEVQPSMVYKSKLCGLCGNYNGDKSDELMSPRMCLLSKPELFVQSYAIPEHGRSSCISDESIKEKLRKETSEKCVKVNPARGITTVRHYASYMKPTSSHYESEYEITTYRSSSSDSSYESSSSRISSEIERSLRREQELEESIERSLESSYSYESYGTGVDSVSGRSSSYEYPSGSSRSNDYCYRRTHNIIRRFSRVCFSKYPSVDCSAECRLSSEVSKPVRFHCFRETDPMLPEIRERVYNGERVPELENMSTDMVRNINVPVSCKARSSSSSSSGIEY